MLYFSVCVILKCTSATSDKAIFFCIISNNRFYRLQNKIAKINDVAVWFGNLYRDPAEPQKDTQQQVYKTLFCIVLLSFVFSNMNIKKKNFTIFVCNEDFFYIVCPLFMVLSFKFPFLKWSVHVKFDVV